MSTTDTIKVRIDKCTIQSQWYDNKIGEIREVVEYPLQNGYYITANGSMPILRSDCTVIGESGDKEVVKLPVKMIPNSNIFEDADGNCGSVTFVFTSADLNERAEAWYGKNYGEWDKINEISSQVREKAVEAYIAGYKDSDEVKSIDDEKITEFIDQNKPSDNFNGHIIQGWVKGVRDFYKYINNQK